MMSFATTMALLRGLHLAATLSLLGTIGFIAWTLPAALADQPADGSVMLHPLVRLWRISGLVALLAGLAWFVLQTAAIAGAAGLNEIAAALPVVAEHTRYGLMMLIRLVLVVAATLLAGSSRFRLYPALVLAAAALALQGLIGHAGAMEGRTGTGLLVSESLHLLAAGLWLGALVPLWLCIGRLPPGAGALVCERFSPIGLGCVLVIAGTGMAQGIELIGGLPALVGTGYGRIALLKIALFLIGLVLAALNRLRLTDLLSQGDADAGRRLRLSVSCETLTGLMIILAAAFLASSMPATHETPIWPFPRRLNLDALSDPSIGNQLLVLLLPSAVAGALVLISWVRRPAFLASLAVLAATLAWATPRLAPLLTVEAYPTTFAASPTEFADSSIVHGAALYAANCTPCHGAEARGDGPAAKTLPVRPADLTAAHFWAHTEGDLFWYISYGMNTPSGAALMPAFGSLLSSDDRWALIDFLKAHNAASSLSASGRWGTPIPLPQFDAVCADGSTINLDDLHGRVLHIITDAEAELPSPAPDGTGVTTILLSPAHQARPAGATCVTVEPAAWNAFAILLGVAPAALAETQLLADQNGWLRVRWRPGDPGDWNDPQVLAGLVHDIVTHPLAAAAGGHAHHH